VVFDLPINAARSVLRLVEGAGQELEKHSTLDERLHEAIVALHRSADAMEKHVEVLEGLAASLPALTDAVARLSDQLSEVLHLAAPLESAEREAAGLRRLFHRQHHPADAGTTADPPA
jgi:phage shock protein A